MRMKWGSGLGEGRARCPSLLPSAPVLLVEPNAFIGVWYNHMYPEPVDLQLAGVKIRC